MANGKTKKMKVYLESTISGYATARPTSDARAGYKPPKILDARQFMEAYDEH